MEVLSSRKSPSKPQSNDFFAQENELAVVMEGKEVKKEIIVCHHRRLILRHTVID
jgi:hypothetical protein